MAIFGWKTERKQQKTKNKKQRTDSKEQRADSRLKWNMVGPAEYRVRLKDVKKPIRLVFSERFDRGWIAKIAGSKGQKTNSKKQIAKSAKTVDGLNSFLISKRGDLDIKVVYAPQRYVNYGLIISGITLFFVVSYLLFKNL
jgi:hypothetical protein